MNMKEYMAKYDVVRTKIAAIERAINLVAEELDGAYETYANEVLAQALDGFNRELKELDDYEVVLPQFDVDAETLWEDK